MIKRTIKYVILLLSLLFLMRNGISGEASSPIIDGGTIPDLEGISIDGKFLRLSDYAGKYVLIEFWASWCPHCMEDHSEYVKIYPRYKKNGFEIVGISTDKYMDLNFVKGMLKRTNANWPQLALSTNKNGRISDRLNLRSQPANILLDLDRRIIGINLTPKDLTIQLDDVFSKNLQSQKLTVGAYLRETHGINEFERADEIWNLSREPSARKVIVDNLISESARTQRTGIYSDSKIIRRWATYILGKRESISKTDVAEPLSGEYAKKHKFGIYDHDVIVRSYSVEVLGRLADGDADILDALIENNAKDQAIGLYDREPIVRAYTIWALSQSSSNREYLSEVLTGGRAREYGTGFYDKNSIVVTYAVEAMGRVGDTESILGLMFSENAKSSKNGYYSEDRYVRAYSVKALAGIKDKKLIPTEDLVGDVALKNGIGIYDGVSLVRANTVEVLGGLDSANDRIVDVLCGVFARDHSVGLYDRDSSVREAATSILLESVVGKGGSIKDYLFGNSAETNRMGIYSERADIRSSACLLLGREENTGIDVSEALVSKMAKEKHIGIFDRDIDARVQAVWALGRYDNRRYPGLSSILRSLINDPDKGIQAEAKKALERVSEMGRDK